MIILGLTGSIGMGKTTAAGIFRRLGVPVFDADQSVHDFYDGPAVELLGKLFPDCVRGGRVDRKELGTLVLSDPERMAKLESVVHPLVLDKRLEFLRKMTSVGAQLVVVDVPLLFETRGEFDVDAIIVASASANEQRQRVLSRPGMNEGKLKAILSRQVPDVEKRRRAHFIIQTRKSVESTKRQIETIVASVLICNHKNKNNLGNTECTR